MLSIIFLACGCNSEKTKITELTETEVTIAFFDAIYNKKDLKSIIVLSSASFKQKVKKYKTAQNFSRRLLNISFDSVEIEAQESNTEVIDELNISITMTALLTGKRNGSTYKDIKKIFLVKEGNIWLVDKLLDK